MPGGGYDNSSIFISSWTNQEIPRNQEMPPKIIKIERLPCSLLDAYIEHLSKEKLQGAAIGEQQRAEIKAISGGNL